jgi:MazG family protein
MRAPPSRKLAPIRQVLEVMTALRAPDGCPWDREQDHNTLRYHAVEEVYELLDAIEDGDDGEMLEELGDLLLQVVFHSQLAKERGVFDFDQVCQTLVDKLVRRHPHVFGDTSVKSIDQVWANWEKIKRAEKVGTHRERSSALDGVPRHLPGLMRAQKVVKKAMKAGLETAIKPQRVVRRTLAKQLFEIAQVCQIHGWSAEELLRQETARREGQWRKKEKATP